MIVNPVHRFFLPNLTRGFIVRLFVVIVAALLFFTQVLIPLRIDGRSMEPAYHDGGFTFCWRFRYLVSEPGHRDVVAIRFSGPRLMLLKRIVALAGETVEFRNGILFVNGKRIEEPHVQTGSDWNLALRTVEPGKVYVVGDNRSVPMLEHQFGQVERQRIIGGVLW